MLRLIYKWLITFLKKYSQPGLPNKKQQTTNMIV